MARLDRFGLDARSQAVGDSQRIGVPPERGDGGAGPDELAEVAQLEECVEIHRVAQLVLETAYPLERVQSNHGPRVRDEIRAPGQQHLRQRAGVIRCDRLSGAVDRAFQELSRQGLIYTGRLDPPKGQTPDDRAGML